MPKFIILAAAALLTVANLQPAGLGAHEGATGIVKERMDAMKSLGDAMKRLAAMMKGEAAYDGYAIARDADLLARHGGEAMTKLFPAGSTQHPTEALPAIWEDWSGFEALAREMQTAAAALGQAAQAGGAEPSKAAMRHFRDTARTCKACHDDFRERQ